MIGSPHVMMNGIVHIAGTHTESRVYAECGVVLSIITRSSVHGDERRYPITDAEPTCIMCVGQYFEGFVTYEEIGEAIINPAALSKIRLDD